ncbi:hypothetical protein D3P96_07875 [Weissella viridescens]|uniref:Helix-hairpin-helix DNA-binding motif class 1 domain-containing protein n=1 Tax=Weissella viridescens TaxID=1629 RepID=A0A3P2REU6_WEIVI|nr:helix-hairpin-helix domain-containing protein [Weissella viridescens]RRG17390.1 hypothetical protein D3P96_07875 [Weissella viridescens]
MESFMQKIQYYNKKYSSLKYILIVALGIGVLVQQYVGQNVAKTQRVVPEVRMVSHPDRAVKKDQVASSVIHVDVKGAVKSPNVYLFNQNERIQDAIRRAGGIIPQAETKDVNLAQKLTDGLMLYIPRKGEQSSKTPSGQNNAVDQTKGKLDINQVTVTELQQIPGIGPKRAADIISFRETSGPFKSIDDLSQVSGFGPKTVQKIRDYFQS